MSVANNMMKMKNKLSMIAGTLISGVFLAAASVSAHAATDLVVYTTWETDDLSNFKKAFEEDNPDINIEWVRDSTGVIAARLMAEKDRPQADAAWGIAITTMARLADEDLLEPYKPDNFDNLDEKFRDNAESPRWFGNTAWTTAIIFNEREAERLGLEKPTSWKDLIDPAYKGQIVMPHPASSGTGYFYNSAWLQLFGEEEGWEYMDALHENIDRYMHSGSAPGVTAARGDYAIGLSFEVRGARLKQDGAPIDIILPDEGLGWDMQTFGIIKGTDKLDAAKRLADWAASEKAMKMYGSVRSITAMPGTAAPIEHLPENISDLIIEQDFSWSAKERNNILDEWENRYGYKADSK